MRHILTLILLVFAIHFSALAQSEEKIYTKVEVEASFPGGEAAWRRYLQNNLDANTPIENGAPPGTYTAIVKFLVDKEGILGQIEPVTSLGYGMEDELIRTIKLSGKWVPAKQNERSVNSYKRQAMTFVCEAR